MCLAFCELDFETTLHFSETDYNVITENGEGVRVCSQAKVTIICSDDLP